MNLEWFRFIAFVISAVSLILLVSQKYKLWLLTTAIYTIIFMYSSIDYNNVVGRQNAFVMFVAVLVGVAVTHTEYLKLNKWEYFPYILEGGAIALMFNSFAGIFDSAMVRGNSLIFMYYIMLFGLLGMGYFMLAFRCYIGLLVLGFHYVSCIFIWEMNTNASSMSVLYVPGYCVILSAICFYGYFKLNRDYKEMIENEKKN